MLLNPFCQMQRIITHTNSHLKMAKYIKYIEHIENDYFLVIAPYVKI